MTHEIKCDHINVKLNAVIKLRRVYGGVHHVGSDDELANRGRRAIMAMELGTV